MIGAVTYIVREANPPIHWEAVLVTAIPASIAAVAAIVTGLLGRRNKAHLQAIDQAVNGVDPGVPSLREKVESIEDKVSN